MIRQKGHWLTKKQARTSKLSVQSAAPFHSWRLIS